MACPHHGAMVWLDMLRVALFALWTALLLGVKKVLGLSPRKDLQDKVVLLTGAGGGLGRRLALELVRKGCVVGCVDVDEAANEETAVLARQATKNAGAARSYVADLRDRGQVYDVVRRVTEDLGRVDILVNNASIILGKPVMELSDEELDAIIDVNLKSAFWIVRAVLPGMRERGSGHIVTISSAAAFTGFLNYSAYSASKGGLTAFMESLQEEIVRVGCEPIVLTTVHPYVIATERVQDLLSTRLPILDADNTACDIVSAIQEGKSIVVLPSCYALVGSLHWLLPRPALNYLHQVFYTYPKRPIEDRKEA